MATEKRSLLLELLAKDKTAAATRSAADNLDDVADAAKDADRAAEKFGRTGRTAAEHVEHLDREIEACERELHQLAVAFAEAETVADRTDLSGAIRRTETDLKRLSKARGQLQDLVPDVEPGKLRSIGTKLGAALGSSIGPTAGAVAAPLVISALGGAISAGAGAGAIGIGIGLAVARDPAIQAAGKELGKKLFDEAGARAHSAFGKPVMELLDDLGTAGEQVVDQWGDAFDKLAPAVKPFIKSILDGVTSLSGTIADIAGDSGPLLKVLGDGFEDVADSVGGALRRITGDSERNADGLAMVFSAASTTIDILGWLAAAAAEAAKPLIWLYEAGEKAGEGIGKAALAIGAAEEPLHKIRALHGDAATAMDKTTAAAYDEKAALVGLSNTLKGLTDPTFALVAAQDDLAKAQQDATKAQKEHGKNSPEYRAALRQATEAALSLEAAAGKVATTSTGKLDPALRATLQAAGLTKGEIKALEREFGDAKKSGDRFAKTYQAKVEVLGLEAAKRVAKRISDTLHAIKDENVNINYTTSGGVNSSRLRSNLDKNREFGGPVRKGHAYVVGERRPEVFVPDRDGKIVPSIEQYQRSIGTSYGGGRPAGGTPPVIPAQLVVRFDFGDSAFGQLLSKAVRTQPALAASLGQYIRAAS
ncbi:hypothetical protein [Actinoplanes ianthinogenes]|uniref:hypothetical protein n=1 Tax=Actinoplanes ianthinogenes TaxID=122358 RepID=UPI00166FE5D2|nr:hypothetical protein [Actinoplanes ianthinogenes]